MIVEHDDSVADGTTVACHQPPPNNRLTGIVAYRYPISDQSSHAAIQDGHVEIECSGLNRPPEDRDYLFGCGPRGTVSHDLGEGQPWRKGPRREEIGKV